VPECSYRFEVLWTSSSSLHSMYSDFCAQFQRNFYLVLSIECSLRVKLWRNFNIWDSVRLPRNT